MMRHLYHRLAFPFGQSAAPARFFLAAILIALLSHCGGGAETKSGSNGTGSPAPLEDGLVASGPITALGPTGIGGTALDETTALVQINAQLPRPVSDIRLGMTTEAGGTLTVNAPVGMLRTLTAQSALLGPVTAINAAAQRLTVLSVTVQLDQNTILDGFPGLSGLEIGTRVEVYGLQQPQSNIITATRLIALPANNSAPVEILGIATALSSNQFNLLGVRIATGSAILIQPGLQLSPAPPVASIGENARVRAIGSFDAAGNTVTASQVVGGLNPVRNDNSILVLDGLVQSVSAAGRFRLNDTDVDATAATGGLGVLTPGAHVQVRGRKVAGILGATEFRLIAVSERIVYTVQGEISAFTAPPSFRLRGELISAASATFIAGTAADLANGRRVRVKAVAGPGLLSATEITFLP